MRMSEDILERFRNGFELALAAGIPEANAMMLATADGAGRPGGRVVLLKGHDADGFVFYTNLGSRKAVELAANPRACLVFWWRETEQQVIIDGAVTQVGDDEADAYFASRPRGSQIGAWASKQSAELDSRETFVERIRHFEAEFEGRDVPRPAHWSGFRLEPERIEFWYGREFRWHERVVFTAEGGDWVQTLLYP